MRVVTGYWAKPIPDRSFDWSAIDDDTYDGAVDSCNCCQIGYGRTEAQAIGDLLDQLELPADAVLEVVR
jgi:hypothetical protein